MTTPKIPSYAYAVGVNVRREPPVSDAVRQEIGGRIRQRRESLGLSQSQLGARLRNAAGNPIGSSQLSKWELGKMLPSRFYWPQLADALDTDQVAIFGGLVDEGDGMLANRVDELEQRIDALADILGVRDALNTAVRARRTTSRGGDASGEDLSPADLAGRLGDQDEPGDKAASG